MASAAEQLAANLNFGAFAKAEELKKRIWFTLAALLVYRLGTYIPIPGINPIAFAPSLQEPVLRHPRHGQHVRGRRHRADGDLRPQHHALHLGLHHHAADAERGAVAGGAEEGGRAGPQAAQPVHALPHGRAGRLPGVRHRLWPASGQGGALRAGGARSGPVLRPDDGGDAGRRHDVPDVARRADHGARRRQRHVAHHHGRHRGGLAERRSWRRWSCRGRASSPCRCCLRWSR